MPLRGRLVLPVPPASLCDLRRWLGKPAAPQDLRLPIEIVVRVWFAEPAGKYQRERRQVPLRAHSVTRLQRVVKGLVATPSTAAAGPLILSNIAAVSGVARIFVTSAATVSVFIVRVRVA